MQKLKGSKRMKALWQDPTFREKHALATSSGISGHHDSPLAGRIYYRSLFEFAAYLLLDEQTLDVATYAAEPFSIPYVSPDDGSQREYFPDVLVTYHDGTRLLIEIKPRWEYALRENRAKWAAARAYVAQHDGWFFEVWDEKVLFPLGRKSWSALRKEREAGPATEPASS